MIKNKTAWLAGPLLLLMVAAAVAAPPAPDAQAVSAYAKSVLVKTYAADAPGAAVLVARGDEVLFRDARGMASLELSVPLSPDHVFRIGSVTKQFAAAALLKLVEAGKISLDDPLSRFVPDYPNGDAITVLQLLNHSSGVKSYTGIEGVMDGPIRIDRSTSELIDYFKDHPVDFAPGTSLSYNNSGYVLVGAVIEAASGMSWDAWHQQALAEPLKLSQTRYGADDLLVKGMASGYGADASGTRPARYLSMTQPHAAGALVSTVDDLHRWNRALHGGGFLSPALYQKMVTPEGVAMKEAYGFGIIRKTLHGAQRLSHGGGIPGFSSLLLYLPEQEISVVVLQNSDASDDASELATRLAAYALGKPFPEEQVFEVSEDELRGFEGIYRIDGSGTREIRVVDGVLISHRSGGQRLPLIPVAKDKFLFAGDLVTLGFERDKDGSIRGLVVHYNGEDEGQHAVKTDQPLSAGRQVIELSSEQQQRLLGRYQGAPGAMTVFVDGGALKVQLQGQPAFDLFAESADRFFLTVVDATLVFEAGAKPAASLTLKQGGAEIEFVRKD
jgi:D-alanyl-D-alanine carboxypeptidase